MTQSSRRIFTRISLSALTAGMILVSASVSAQQINIGTIEEAKRITLKSSGAAGGVAGAVIGYNAGSGNSDSKKRRRAVIGGAVGSAAASSTQPGMEYTVRFNDGTTSTLISDQVELEIGQCVSVEIVGESANIREQDPVACNPEMKEVVSDLQDELAEDANECAEAKQALLEAKTMDEVEVATAKAQILCN